MWLASPSYWWEGLGVLLSLDGLSKSFGSLKVTDDITLDVPEGQALGVLGPNGAGKTTLFNLISGTCGLTVAACCSKARM